jgi:hypothetical protein
MDEEKKQNNTKLFFPTGCLLFVVVTLLGYMGGVTLTPDEGWAVMSTPHKFLLLCYTFLWLGLYIVIGKKYDG